MNKIAALLLITFMMGNNAGLFGQPIKESKETTYNNPLPVVFADPYVLYVKGDKYYMYETGGVKNGFAAYSSIDLCIGKVKDRYGLQAIQWVYGVELKPDFSGVIGEPVLLLRPPVTMKDKQAEWENRSVTSKEVNRRWTEGSVTFKKGGIYYIMHSANYFGGKNYTVGYASSKSPLGSFKKSDDDPILSKNVYKGYIDKGLLQAIAKKQK